MQSVENQGVEGQDRMTVERDRFLEKLLSLDIKLRIVDKELKINAPKGALTPNLIRELKERKQELIHFLAGVGGADVPGIPPIEVVDRNLELPLSFAQQRLWFIDQLEEHRSAVYNVPVILRLEGRLDVETLKRCFMAMVERHETLRTSFVTENGTARLLIRDQPHVPFEFADCSHLPEEQRSDEIRQSIEQECGFFFNLAQGSLLRIRLMKEQPETHVMTIVMHHIIADGWSIGVMVREFAALYEAFAQGKPSPLPPLSLQFADFGSWQHKIVDQGLLQGQLDFWKTTLKDFPQLLALPSDSPRPAVQRFRGRKFYFSIEPDLAASLHETARKAGVTLFMILHAAFSVFLARLTGQTDIVVGTPVANRSRVALEALIGLFVNTLVLRCNLEDRPTFAELLQRIKHDDLAAFDHQDAPFDLVLEALEPERTLSYTPLFQTMFAFQNTPDQILHLPGLTVSPVEPEHTTARVDFSLEMSEARGRFIAIFEYNTDLFEPETIHRWSAHFVHLLKAIVRCPETPVYDLEIIDKQQMVQLETFWHGPAVPYPDTPVFRLFEEQSARKQDAPALRLPAKGVAREADLVITYEELNEQSNRLSHYLREHGVGPGSVVGICLDRSQWLVIALLAIWKTGASYLPLDPEYPKERLAFMIADSGITIMLANSDDRSDVKCLDPIASWPEISLRSGDNPEITPQVDDPAYLIYTSGSTGRPKGALITHGNLANFAHAAKDRFGFDEQDVSACYLSFSFDIFLYQLFMPLLSGGQTLFLTRAQVLDLGVFVSIISELTALHGVPAIMKPVTDHMLQEGLTCISIRKAFIGGDRVDASLMAAMAGVFPNARIFEDYGPTEGTILCTGYQVADPGAGHANVIGKPLNNVVIRLYDHERNIVPLGVPGELYIGGAGVASGYWNRKELTRDKFVEIEGERFYRSGDLARFLPDGNLQFLGRIDHQVQIRGFRIEPGEIQTVLDKHPMVQQNLVMVRGETQLTAYVICHQQEDESRMTAMLADYLRQWLPDYMIPASWVFSESFPLTPNGKIDRAALPDTLAPAPSPSLAPPRSVSQKQIAAIWREVLNLETVGIYDNFFDIGGNSLLVIRVRDLLKKTFGEIPVVKLFEHTTIASLATWLEDKTAVQRDHAHNRTLARERASRMKNRLKGFGKVRGG